ncbi:MAG: 4Fe-4S dicluster domain-containing protein, partial [Bacteroidales bacterium]|nr:4Fe-4S dicluster domain-containing protein [Bacteroidales bacterium]
DFSVNISWYNSETSSCSQYICPDNYYLESWCDHQPRINYISVQQPVIRPLFKTRQGQESLLRWMKKPGTFYHYIQDYWKKQIFIGSESSTTFIPQWNKILQQGFYYTKGSKPLPQFTEDRLNKSIFNTSDNKDDSSKLVLKLVNSIHTFNDKFSNNPWLQELPHPITKICCDNYASISPVTAKTHRLKTGDIIKLNNTVEIPVVVQPGQHPNVISVTGGFGRTNTGRIADELGICINEFFGFKDGYRQCEVLVSIEKTNKKHEFARTQEEASMHGRDIVRYVNADQLNSLTKKKHSEASLYNKHEFKQFHWGMAIDLNKCTGCSACVISCQAENNIPVVGKSEIAKRRDMHWLRIDRYYDGNDENPKVLFQPVMCQHCDQAPCENVCPVSATTHSSEGINQMVYSRCVGTRYCSNNCPYKVRRFNWLDYTKADAFNNNTHDPFGMTSKISRLVLNPDVTVRSKGVNEKCSFCFQRIAEAKINAKKEDRALLDGEIQTACMQACPSNAIVFGDMNDKNSSISKLIKNNRSYTLLDELHTLPSVHYLSKVLNSDNDNTNS